jgi:thiol-disulfide isomerase/thioredoxin
VLWFWAPWCTECRREAPGLAAVQAGAGDEVTFVGVAGLGEIPEMQAFVEDYELAAFPHLADVDGSIWSRFGISRQPAYAFIDDSGEVEVVRGVLGEQGLADRVAELTAR